jgi:hypothetical protein
MPPSIKISGDKPPNFYYFFTYFCGIIICMREKVFTFLFALCTLHFALCIGTADAVSRAPQNQRDSARVSAAQSLYENVQTIVRALVMPRAVPMTISTRGTAGRGVGATSVIESQPIETKSDYISYLRNGGYVGNTEACAERYNKYTEFFGHNATLSGEIRARKNATRRDRLDLECEFLGYAHWCFAMGFAYAIRDLGDTAYLNNGTRCMTYQEFCNSSRAPSDARVDEYLSKVIDEIMFYNTTIRDTNRNIVSTTTKTTGGTTTGWKNYDTDSWVMERLPRDTMKKLLCD